jgi:hypothetical protein
MNNNNDLNNLNQISNITYQAITRNLLGASHLRFTRKNKNIHKIGNAHLSMSLKSNHYLSYFLDKYYVFICNNN